MAPKWHWLQQDQMYPMCITSVPESQISVALVLRSSVFELQAILNNVHRMTGNNLEPGKVKSTPCTSYYYPWVLILVRFALRPAVFKIQAILRLMHRGPKNDLEHYKLKVKCTAYISLVCPILKSQFFHSTANRFKVTSNFVESASSDPKWTWSAVYETQAILRQVHQMTWKSP